jgi:hypothetical protein
MSTDEKLDLDDFFADASDAPAYIKFEEGKTRVRILSQNFTLGFEGWWNNKPVRVAPKEQLTEREKQLLDKNKGKDGSEYPKYKQFAACLVWNYEQKAVQIWSFTQQSITKQLLALRSNPDWGNLGEFDITVERKGKGFDTEYTIIPSPMKKLAEEVVEALERTRLDPESLLLDDSNTKRVHELRTAAGTAKLEEPGDIPF